MLGKLFNLSVTNGALPVENCPVQQLFICCTGWGVVVEFHQCRELILYDLSYQD